MIEGDRNFQIARGDSILPGAVDISSGVMGSSPDAVLTPSSRFRRRLSPLRLGLSRSNVSWEFTSSDSNLQEEGLAQSLENYGTEVMRESSQGILREMPLVRTIAENSEQENFRQHHGRAEGSNTANQSQSIRVVGVQNALRSQSELFDEDVRIRDSTTRMARNLRNLPRGVTRNRSRADLRSSLPTCCLLLLPLEGFCFARNLTLKTGIQIIAITDVALSLAASVLFLYLMVSNATTSIDIAVFLCAIVGTFMARMILKECSRPSPSMDSKRALWYHRWRVFSLTYLVILPIVRIAFFCLNHKEDGEKEGLDTPVECQVYIAPLIGIIIIYSQIQLYLIWVTFSFWAQLAAGNWQMVIYGPRLYYKAAAREVEVRAKAMKTAIVMESNFYRPHEINEGIVVIQGHRQPSPDSSDSSDFSVILSE